jgi:hypothetical protein
MYAPARTAAALASLLLLACGAERETALRADAVLSDGRTGGTPGFFFLPPVAPEPAAKENDRGLSPVVEVIALEPAGPALVTFSGAAVKESGSHYLVHWSTKEAPPVAGTTYRVRVLLGGELLGFADAAVARDGRELLFLASGETFGLKGRRTVPVKFRIGAAAGEDGDGDEDGVPDGEDRCPTVDDPSNQDSDGDGVGDACECLDPACTPPSECQVGACDPLVGCTFSSVEDGTSCTFGDGTQPAACSAGVCEPVGESKPAP